MVNDTPADDTADLSEAPVASGSRKRGRDEDQDEDSSKDDGRVVRQRTNSYRPSRGEAIWQTLTKPFRSFVDGFKQGLNSTGQPSPGPTT